ncbi:hypothetical protein D3C76_1557270 [compost metagenome]
MGHGGGVACAVPMLLPRPDLLNGLSPQLDQAAAGGDDQGLAKGMDVPGGAGPRFEGDADPEGAGRGIGREQGIDAHRAGEVVAWTLAGGL